MAGYEKIIVEDRSKLRIIRFNTPKRKNAWDVQAYHEIGQALREANIDPKISAVALTGTGDFYSSGNDIKAAFENTMTNSDPAQAIKASNQRLSNMIDAFLSFEKLLIAVINGPCLGIAFTTAVLCDVIYATKAAYFQTPFTTLALSAEGCSSVTFPRIMGSTKAAEMLLLSEKMYAEEALRFNVVSRVFADLEEMDRVLWPKIQEYSELPIGSLMATKKLMRSYDVEELMMVNQRELKVLASRLGCDEVIEAAMKFLSRKNKL